MQNNKIYYQGCISMCERDCYAMECKERDKCEQFKEYKNEFKKEVENAENKI